MLEYMKLVVSTCGNLFSKNNQRLKYVFKKKDLSKMKNPLKIISTIFPAE